MTVFSQTWMAKEATTELLSDVGIHLTRAFLTVLLNSVLSGSSYGRQTFLLVLVVGCGDVHSSMPTSLSLLIPSSTICHHSNWHFKSIQHRYHVFLLGAILIEILHHFLGFVTRCYTCISGKYSINSITSLWVYPFPTSINQPQNPISCIFSLLLLTHTSYLLQLLWRIVLFLSYQAQCFQSTICCRD